MNVGTDTGYADGVARHVVEHIYRLSAKDRRIGDDLSDGESRDLMNGGRGNDRLVVRGGADLVWGASGSDKIVVWPDGRRDYVNCGRGADLVVFPHEIRERHDKVENCERIRLRHF